MKIFVESANLDEIAAAKAMGVSDGVYTTQALIEKEGREVNFELLEDISQIVLAPIVFETKMLGESAEEIAEITAQVSNNYCDDFIVTTVPMTAEGLKVVKEYSNEYSDEDGPYFNCTLVLSSAQAFLAARAGARYVSPFLGSLDAPSNNGTELIKEIASILSKSSDRKTEIIATNIRTPHQAMKCALAGADVIAAPYSVIMEMIEKPLSDEDLVKFKSEYLATL